METRNSGHVPINTPRYRSLNTPDASDFRKTHIVEFLPELQHLVHVDIYRQIIVRDGLLGLHQPLSDHLQERDQNLSFMQPPGAAVMGAAGACRRFPGGAEPTGRNAGVRLRSPCGCC